ncbi:MAG TPA: PQQ-binding-like beta-propeller repeat protein [Armatimonadota bacterium]|nr:PQQ-binding-like beta-propeller repeat protein [Armatimonadota bacterium]
MITAITDYIKSRRGELGRHVLYLGGGVRTSPDEVRVLDVLYEVARDWAGEQQIELPEDEPGPAALELMAQRVDDMLERCRRVRARTAKNRPSEGHTRLARMISDGYFPAVFTADPTDLLQVALHNHHMEPDKDYHLLAAGLDSADDIALALASSTRVVVVKCVGAISREFMPLSKREVSAAIDSIAPAIESAFKTLALFVAYTDRERPFIRHVPREGDRAFWVNRIIPMDDEDLYQELKLESPDSVDYHRLQPDVMEMLRLRTSARHLICREPGEPSAFFSALEDRLSRHRRSTGRTRRGPTALSVLSGGPYRFLDHYDPEDSEIFFGRERDVAAVVDMIKEHQLSVLFGPSGRGKTSLLLAGVIPALQAETQDPEQQDWLPVVMRCGEDPSQSAIEAVTSELHEAGLNEPEQADDLADFLGQAIERAGRILVLFIDQYEEFFVRLGEPLRRQFMEQLQRALQLNPGDLRVLLSIREDYLGELWELQEWLPRVMHNLYRLKKLSPLQAKMAAMKPGSRFHIKIEEELVERVLDDIAREDGVEPTELQIVMDRLYQTMSPERHVLGAHAYDQLSGADRILSDYLEHALGQLSPSERRLARNVLKNMVASSELKAVRSAERIAAETDQSYEQVEKLLARLEDLRLVRRTGKPERHEYEVVHEYVARKIDEWLTQSEVEVKDVQDLLTREVNNWEKFGLLMQEGALRLVYQNRDELTISPAEMELIVRSAVLRGQNADHWLGRADELRDRLVPTFRDLLSNSEPGVRQAAAKALKPHVSAEYLPELVELLTDRDQEVRARAEEYLRSLDRELIELLGRGTDEQRHLAAFALGRIESRRALRPLADALDDTDKQMREEVAGALMEMNPVATARLLLRRLRENREVPWAVAYALGRVAHDPRTVREIEHAYQTQPPSAQVTFALAMAWAHRREWDEALGLLDQAAELSTTQVGLETIASLRDEIGSQRQRATQERHWPMFHGDLARTGLTNEIVTPPLEERWSFRTRGPVVASPAVLEGLVCVGSRDSYLYGLDAATGALRWELRTGDRIEGAPCLTHQTAYAVSRDGGLYAVALRDGELRWKLDTGAASRSSPAVFGGLVYAGNQDGLLLAADARTGEVRWRMKSGDEISAAPMISNDLVIVGSWDGTLYALSAASGEEAWQADAHGPVASSASALDGRVYCGSDADAVFAFDASTGHRLWKQDVGARVRSCPALAGGMAVVGAMDGRVHALSLDDGSPVWSARTAEEILASPVVSGRMVYLGSKDGTLYALSLDDGAEVWSYKTSYAIYSSPAIAGQMVVLGMQYYDVVAFTGREFKPGALR